MAERLNLTPGTLVSFDEVNLPEWGEHLRQHGYLWLVVGYLHTQLHSFHWVNVKSVATGRVTDLPDYLFSTGEE